MNQDTEERKWKGKDRQEGRRSVKESKMSAWPLRSAFALDRLHGERTPGIVAVGAVRTDGGFLALLLVL